MSKSLLSEELISVLTQQISHERYNSNFYMYISGFLKNKGLDNLGEIFLKQHDEEINHSKQIYEFLTDMNAPVNLIEINAVNASIKSIIDLATLYLDREIATTKDLEAIKEVCIDENNGVAEEFLRKMIDQQRAELEEASTFMDNAELCGEDWWKVKVWNDGLGD